MGVATRYNNNRWRRLLGICAGAAVVSVACIPPVAVPLDPLPLPVTEYTVASGFTGVSFTKVADVIGGADQEIIVSRFGAPTTAPGSVTILERGSDLDEWTATPVVTAADNIKFPNDTEVADLNNDGLADLIVSGGFFSCSFGGTGCGSLQWMEQGPAGVFTRHNIIAPDNERFYHRAIVTDVDGDGITDLVTVGETFTSARTEWYRGTALGGAARFEPTPLIIGAGGGSLPVVTDVDGDGDDDVVSPQYFHPGPAVIWFERVAEPTPGTPAGTWVQRTFSSAIGRGFEVDLVPDLLGDGTARWIGTNHQNTVFDPSVESAVWRFDAAPDVTAPWAATKISTGIQSRPKSPTTLAPGLFGTGDIDLDGSTDIVVSGDGDDRLFVMLQQPDDSFTTYVLASNMGQAGGAEVTDLDGDGRPEALFTSYEQGVVKLYEIGS